jgi:hypothetical protein
MILPAARLADGGTAITARVRILCRPNGTLWEGFINATQGDTFTLAGLPLTCDGRPHVEAVTIAVNDPATGTFEAGDVIVSASILDEDTLTVYAQDTELVSVR